MGDNYNDWGDGSILSDIDIQNEMAKGNLFIAPYEPFYSLLHMNHCSSSHRGII